MRRTYLAVAAALLFLSGTAAHALYMRWGKGDPKHPISASFWPKGAEAGNQVWTELSSPVTQRPKAATARAVNQKVTASAVR